MSEPEESYIDGPSFIESSELEEVTDEVSDRLKKMESKEISNLQRLALKYQPSVRALLGAILDQLNFGETDLLKNSLNPITRYNLKGADKILSTTEKWNIK